jgi:hypothetical protein
LQQAIGPSLLPTMISGLIFGWSKCENGTTPGGSRRYLRCGELHPPNNGFFVLRGQRDAMIGWSFLSYRWNSSGNPYRRAASWWVMARRRQGSPRPCRSGFWSGLAWSGSGAGIGHELSETFLKSSEWYRRNLRILCFCCSAHCAGVKGSQVQIMSSRRHRRAVPLRRGAARQRIYLRKR